MGKLERRGKGQKEEFLGNFLGAFVIEPKLIHSVNQSGSPGASASGVQGKKERNDEK